MQLPELNDSKKDFQLERLILFTDAVFAIAITLLIIEIKAPHIHHDFTTGEKVRQLAQLTSKFIAFMVSFFVIGIYWRSHHRLFGFLHSYDNKLITLNLMFLFTIVCMPFSSAYDSENVGQTIAYGVYCLNVAATGFFNYLLLKHIAKSKNGLSDHFQDPLLYQYLRGRVLIVPSIFLLTIVFDCFIHGAGRCLLILIWPAMRILANKFKKKREALSHPPKTENPDVSIGAS